VNVRNVSNGLLMVIKRIPKVPLTLLYKTSFAEIPLISL
jgi:hypothetical protein